ncbi:hypothetical protein HZU67_08786 [Apis mellifera carnica]|nr:hypothetical protein HZU67_08786 [Apis mellifera carnica]
MSGKKLDDVIDFFTKICKCMYDEKTEARIRRENEETWKGFVALEKCKRSLKEIDDLKLKVEKKDEKEIEEEKEEYEWTKWTKLKILRQKREYEMWKEHWNKYKVMKFCTAVIRLKILKYKKEKKKQERLREQRKMQIIAKIIREMNDDVLSRKPKYICSKRYKIKEITSVEETSFEDFRNEELAIVEKDKSMEEQVAEESEKDYRIEDLSLEEYDDKTKPKGNEIILKKIVLKKSIKTSLKQKTFPIDTCFYATPSVVIFEIEIMDAARVKPGLNVVVNVKFSPIHEEEVMADIAFLTLSPDYDNKYHEFRVHVHCTPQLVQPILEPTELRLKIEAKIQIKYPLEIRFRN